MASQPYPAGFGEAEVTLEMGGTGLEPSQALGKGKTLLEPAWDGTTVRKTTLGLLCCGPPVGCPEQSWGRLGPPHILGWSRKWFPGWAGLGSRGLSNGAPTNVLAPPPLLVLTSQCLAAEPLTQPRRGKTSPAPATTEECATHIPPTTPAQVWG